MKKSWKRVFWVHYTISIFFKFEKKLHYSSRRTEERITSNGEITAGFHDSTLTFQYIRFGEWKVGEFSSPLPLALSLLIFPSITFSHWLLPFVFENKDFITASYIYVIVGISTQNKFWIDSMHRVYFTFPTTISPTKENVHIFVKSESGVIIMYYVSVICGWVK